MCFGEEFQVVANKFDAFAVSTVDIHDKVFNFVFIVIVYEVNKIMHDGSFAGAGCAVEQNVGYFVVGMKVFQFFFDRLVDI
jgi:hypothetical protein